MIKNIYKYSPLLFQNLFITIENSIVLYKKYGYIPIFKSMKTIKNEIQDISMNYNEEELSNKLVKFIEYSKIHSEYYKDYNYINNISDIEKLPILKKNILKNNTNEFYSNEISRYNSRKLHTSGSTGSPMKIYVATKDLQFRYRLILKAMLNFGFDINSNYARITGHDICDENVIFRKDFLNNYYYLSAFHISEKTYTKYYSVLKENNIKVLDGYPSAIYLLAKLFEQNNISLSLDMVVTTAEKLHNYQKELIEKIFNCNIFDYYGSNEQSLLFYTCKHGKIHVSNKTGYLEVLNKDYEKVSNGEVGKIIVTSLTSSFMPLIRYDIGDACIVSENQTCTCGDDGVIIDEIIGRDEDIFKTIDGKYITRFSVVLKYLPNEVQQSQLILNNTLVQAKLIYESTAEIEPNKFKEFKKILASKIGNSYVIEIKKVESIQKTSKAKLKAVIIEN